MITAREILCLPELQNVTVRTGSNGLSRKVTWVHVIDHHEVGHFLEGGELLLTCGQLWPKDKELEKKILTSFLRHQISGILFATGRYLSQCPPTVLEFGEKFSIPILEVPFQVPFVKVTRAIHEKIIERKEEIESLSNRVPLALSNLLKSAASSKEVCDILSASLKCHALLTDHSGAIFVHSSLSIKNKQTMGELLYKLHEKAENQYMNNGSHKIQINSHKEVPPYVLMNPFDMGDSYGTLWLLDYHKSFTDEHKIVLKHAANILTNLFGRLMEEKSKQMQLQSELLELLLEKQKAADIVIENKLREMNMTVKGKWMAGLILSGDIDSGPVKLSQLGLVRNLCNEWFGKENGVKGFCGIYQDQIILLMNTKLNYDSLNGRLTILKNNLRNIIPSTVIVMGDVQENVLTFVDSFKKAKTLAPIIQYKNASGGIYFSGQWRREILLYGKLSTSEAYTLRKKLLPDRTLSERGEVLYETLKALASHHYNREKTAKELHIHRNTLRYRIEKIEQLLEDNINSPQCQFWIQAALDLESLSLKHAHQKLKDEANHVSL